MGLYCPNDSSNSDGNGDLDCVSNCDRDCYSDHTTYAYSYCNGNCFGYGYGDCDGSTDCITITVKSGFAFTYT